MHFSVLDFALAHYGSQPFILGRTLYNLKAYTETGVMFPIQLYICMPETGCRVPMHRLHISLIKVT